MRLAPQPRRAKRRSQNGSRSSIASSTMRCMCTSLKRQRAPDDLDSAGGPRIIGAGTASSKRRYFRGAGHYRLHWFTGALFVVDGRLSPARIVPTLDEPEDGHASLGLGPELPRSSNSHSSPARRPRGMGGAGGWFILRPAPGLTGAACAGLTPTMAVKRRNRYIAATLSLRPECSPRLRPTGRAA